MDGRGWKPEYGISAEGIEILGYVEALPREVRQEMAEAVAKLCKAQGYLSLHDDVREQVARAADDSDEKLAKVIPLFSRSQRG
jgi:hypothetical protein